MSLFEFSSSSSGGGGTSKAATARSFLSNSGGAVAGAGGAEASSASAATTAVSAAGPVIEGNVATLGGIDCGDEVLSVQHTENGAALCKLTKRGKDF